MADERAMTESNVRPPAPQPADRPLRICLVVSYFHPHASGAETQALAQGAELAARGHDVHVLTHKVPVEPREERIQGIRVHRRIRSVHLGPLFGLSFVLSAAREIRKLRSEIDIFHTHQGMWEAVATGLAARGFGTSGNDVRAIAQPASAGAYGEAELLMRTKGSKTLSRLILRNTALAAISSGIEREWADLGFPGERIVRMASGVDSARFSPGQSKLDHELPASPRVVFTGRLHPQKNLDVLINAWPEVVRASGAALILAGEGPERARLEALAMRLGVAERVVFAGKVADPIEHLRAADAFALPSVAEGMSNSLLEAMATALPCVVSNISGNLDLIADGRTGAIVAENTPIAWAQRLIETLNDRARARSMGADARRLIERTFDLKVVVSQYERLYRTILAGGSVQEASLKENRWP